VETLLGGDPGDVEQALVGHPEARVGQAEER